MLVKANFGSWTEDPFPITWGSKWKLQGLRGFAGEDPYHNNPASSWFPLRSFRGEDPFHNNPASGYFPIKYGGIIKRLNGFGRFNAFGDDSGAGQEGGTDGFNDGSGTPNPGDPGYDTSSTAEDDLTKTAEAEQYGASSQDEADTEATAEAEGTTTASVLDSIKSGATDIFTAALKYGPGIIAAAAKAGVISQSTASTLGVQARTAGAAPAVKAPPGKTPPSEQFSPVVIGAAVLGAVFLFKVMQK